MKRFDMEVRPDHSYYGEGERYEVNPYETKDGDWVKWEDVAKLEESNAQLLDALKKTQAWMSKQPQLQSYNYEDCGTLNERNEYYIAEGIYNNNERLIRQY